MNEATARMKINKLLEAAGWRFFAEGDKPANICLEPGVTIKQSDFDAVGDNFEKTRKGFIDFLLLDAKGFPLIVLEAKAEDKNPLVGKEQARKYARSLNCRFVILSNANLHYFWDLERGNPHIITAFPTPDSVAGYRESSPDPTRLVQEQIRDDYIVLTQRPNYASEAAWKNKTERPGFLQANRLRFLRPYQLKAVHGLQRAVQGGSDRFLFEMATGRARRSQRRRSSSCFCVPAMPVVYCSWLIGWNWKNRPVRRLSGCWRRLSGFASVGLRAFVGNLHQISDTIEAASETTKAITSPNGLSRLFHSGVSLAQREIG